MQKRCRAGGKADASKLQAKLATQLANKISSIAVLDSVGAGALYDAIEESGLAQGNAQMLVAAVDAKVLVTTEVAQSTPANNTQLLVNPEAWMPPNLAQGLQDPRKSFDAKLQLVADFLSLCGCNHPHEKTFKWWFSAVLASHFPTGLPSYQNIFDKYTGFKQVMETSRKHWPLAKIYNYPKTPNQLPDAVFSHIYGDELPCTISIPRLSVIATHHIPQRKNNRLLLGGAALSPAQLGAAGSSSDEINSPAASAAALSQSQPPPQSRSHTDEPEWVRDLKEMLRETKAAKSEPHGEAVKKEQVRALLTDVAEAEGHPQWAKDLLNILGSGSRASSAASSRRRS